MEQLNCARQNLITWIDMYCQGGLKALVTPLKLEREQAHHHAAITHQHGS